MLPIADYDYELPPERIAQTPLEPRDHSRLLVVDRASGALTHLHFYDVVRYLNAGDVLVVNDSRVLPARLYGRKATGGRSEVLLLRQLDNLRWLALVKGKVHVGSTLTFGDDKLTITATVEVLEDDGSRVIRFEQPVNELLPQIGVMPTPPYITHTLNNPERYQTVYSANVGSAAAPTAGLHWTPELIERTKAMGVQWCNVTLHVGLDTFRPVQVDNALDHQMHSEWYEFPAATATAINDAKANGKRVIAVGTTSVRVLESVARKFGDQTLAEDSGWTDIFIYPPYDFKLVDRLITNFHLPRSTLLLLVSALAGRDTMLAAYREAVTQHYRFFSFGDAMLIL